MNISVTEKAVKQLKKMNATGESFLRIEAVSGGCSGMTYRAAIDDEMKDNDLAIYEDHDLRIIAPMKSFLYLDGLNIDYSDDLLQSGFRLTNTNASKSCGCGASFEM
jgi:iron-sulfur cluster assembly protein